MSRWHATLEYFQFPLKVLFFATILLGIGSSIINPNIAFLWEVENPTVILMSEIMRYSGGFLIRLFPFMVFIKVLTRKFEDSVPVFVGFISYVIMNIIILFLEDTTFASYYYGNMLGIQITFNEESIFGAMTRIPFNTGVFTLLLAYFITTRSYLKSRHYTMHGVLSFIDHDTWSMILSIFFSILSGIVLAYAWPFVISAIQYIYEYISNDLLNPMNMFIYGIIDRLSAVTGLQDLPRSAFWYSEIGGTAADNFGVLYTGDVGVWFAKENMNIVTTYAGHLITPYYVINMFIIPSFLIAYYSLVSSRKDRFRYFLFFILAILLSIICGNPLPMEFFMMILSPLLYILYLFCVGILFAGFQILGVAIGYIYEGTMLVTNPGSLLDLLRYFRNPEMLYALSMIATFGVIFFVIFFFATRRYFSKYAIGLFALSDREEVTQRVIDALGGMKNIVNVEATPDKMMVSLLHREQIVFQALKEEGAYLILESKDGYLIRLGNISLIVAKQMKKALAKKNT